MTTSPEAKAFSPAALEVLDALTLLSLNLAAVTRMTDVNQALMPLIGCRAVELLEIYVRRILELIFEQDPHAWASRRDEKISLRDALNWSREELIARAREGDAIRIAGKFEDAQQVLPRYLQAEPFTPEQLVRFIELKEQRNLYVHNNGKVDRAFCDKFPDAPLGEYIDYTRHVVESVAATLVSVQQIDQLLLARYPVLGIRHEAFARTLTQRNARAMELMTPSSDELAQLNAQIPLLGQVDSPFQILGNLISENAVAGLGSMWSFATKDDELDPWYAVGMEGEIVTGFRSLEAAQAFVRQQYLPWDQVNWEEEGDGFTVGSLLVDGQGVALRWPTAKWGGLQPMHVGPES